MLRRLIFLLARRHTIYCVGGRKENWLIRRHIKFLTISLGTKNGKKCDASRDGVSCGVRGMAIFFLSLIRLLLVRSQTKTYWNYVFWIIYRNKGKMLPTARSPIECKIITQRERSFFCHFTSSISFPLMHSWMKCDCVGERNWRRMFLWHM